MKITIQIEDTEDGVAITANPGLMTILRMPTDDITSAGAYAVAALTAMERLAPATAPPKRREKKLC